MKKFLLSAIVVLAVVTVANADPRFGVIGFTNGGLNGAGTAGLFISGDIFNGSVTFGNIETGGATSTDWTVAGNYKMATDSTTAVTFGIGYRSTTGGGTTGTNDQFDVNVGAEKWLSSNVGLTVETAIYSIVKDTGAETKMIFGQTKVGLAYLFN